MQREVNKKTKRKTKLAQQYMELYLSFSFPESLNIQWLYKERISGLMLVYFCWINQFNTQQQSNDTSEDNKDTTIASSQGVNEKKKSLTLKLKLFKGDLSFSSRTQLFTLTNRKRCCCRRRRWRWRRHWISFPLSSLSVCC